MWMEQPYLLGLVAGPAGMEGKGRIGWNVDWVCSLAELTVTRTLQNRLCRTGRRDRASSSTAATAGRLKHGRHHRSWLLRTPTTCDIRKSHTGNSSNRPISTEYLCRFQQRNCSLPSSLFLSLSSSSSRACEKSSFPTVRALINDLCLVAEWLALTHSYSLIGRLPPATNGTWLNTARGTWARHVRAPIETLTRLE
ncbi:hypothetical protein CGRA01v4_11341 [Colletotrichum graminicola]|nr:hypothetical protein CGRA01v4_11341 [Colletotrichum graminicola]